MSGDREPTWYVKASFGAEWGPMTTETLLEMSERGSLASGDLVRFGDDGDWRCVTDVLSQLRLPLESVRESISAPNKSDETPPDAKTIFAPPGEIAVSAGQGRSNALPGWSSYWSPRSADETAAVIPRREVFAGWRSPQTNASEVVAPGSNLASAGSPMTAVDAPSHTLEATGPVLPDPRFERLESWKRERQEKLDRLLAIVNEREMAAARAAEAKAIETRPVDQKAENHFESAQCDELTPEDCADHSTASGPKKIPASPVAPRQPASRHDSWNETLTRWKRSLPDKKVVVAIVATIIAVPLLLWFCWPTTNGHILETYRAIYDELREHRERPQDKTGMAEFVERSQEKLAELIPLLSKRSSADDPDTQLLLQMGQDCLRPMLTKPQSRETQEESNFKKMLAHWDRGHSQTSAAIRASEDPAPASSSGFQE